MKQKHAKWPALSTKEQKTKATRKQNKPTVVLKKKELQVNVYESKTSSENK